MKHLFLCLLFFISFAVNAQSNKPIVKVAGYPFSPYITESIDGRYTGLSVDLVNALNGIQSQVQFEFVATSIANRYKAYAMNRFDMMLFESPVWGWDKIEHEFVPLDIHDGELFISLKDNALDQAYFQKFDGKTLSLVKGYHYKFADWQADPQYLKARFNIQFVNSNEASIVSILRGRAEIAPVTWSYLKFYLSQYPEVSPQILVSTKWDQEYNHGILLNPNAPISKQQLSEWVNLLKKQQILTRLASHYGLEIIAN
ncbi:MULTISPECIES: substrate-binding periplasmic protein [Shewanella]|uniref:Transporter substrate-binding domain-containing protein n=1 Tax=Shewanella holmiensis TaxID=2952222 RepID=A0A9X3AXE5_9GAMM|nr:MULTISPECIES: transporter substrate-binding domain-containing protein [Shewanella]MCT7943113.1 transporter substrate-binding domain-containing protein [Shewanella holmiensis]MDP5145912.1 transporter substrate-binding domain-containing protein [Shewanella sp. ULN5]